MRAVVMSFGREWGFVRVSDGPLVFIHARDAGRPLRVGEELDVEVEDTYRGPRVIACRLHDGAAPEVRESRMTTPHGQAPKPGVHRAGGRAAPFAQLANRFTGSQSGGSQ